MTEATIRGPVPVLFANDMQQAISYYCDTLGFTLASAMPDDEPTWCFLRRDNAAIMLLGSHDHAHDEGHDHDDGDHHEHPHAPALNSVYFYPDNVDALWNELKDEVKVEFPLEDMDYGMREFTIRDPNDYALNFGAPIETAT